MNARSASRKWRASPPAAASATAATCASRVARYARRRRMAAGMRGATRATGGCAVCTSSSLRPAAAASGGPPAGPPVGRACRINQAELARSDRAALNLRFVDSSAPNYRQQHLRNRLPAGAHPLQRLPSRERVRERAAVDVLKLSAERDAVCDAARAHAAPPGELTQVVCGRLTLDR